MIEWGKLAAVLVIGSAGGAAVPQPDPLAPLAASVRPAAVAQAVRPIAPGFEGGQQPLHRRLPKFGFVSLKAMDRAEVRTSELAKVQGDVVTVQSLKDANVINQNVQRVKIMLSGEVGRAVTLKGIAATKGARAAIEAAGGKFEE